MNAITPPHLKWPANADHTAVPYSVFNNQEVYDLEQARLYNGPTWNYLATEAELPEKGSFKSTYIGDTPVVVTRGQDNEMYAWVNRCAHRGAEICRERHGKSEDGAYTCVYHQWSYDAKGDLRGVPFQRGLAGKGGMPKDFDKKNVWTPNINIATNPLNSATYFAPTIPIEVLKKTGNGIPCFCEGLPIKFDKKTKIQKKHARNTLEELYKNY